MFETLKKIISGRPALDTDIAAAEKMVATWRESRDRVKAEFDDAYTRESMLTAAARGERDLAAVTVAQRERGALGDRLSVLNSRVALEEANLQALIHRRAEANNAQEWADFETALAERRKAFVALVKQTEAMAKALSDAEAAAERAFVLMPAKNTDLLPAYTKLEGEMARLLAYVSDGKYGSYRSDYSTMYEDRKRPGLIERSDQDAREMLRMGPFAADQAA